MALVTSDNRKYYFLIGCIGSRLLLAYLAKVYQHHVLLFYLSCMIGSGFWTIWLFDLRQSGLENPNIWWNSLRPVHGSFYFLYAFLNFTENPIDYYILFLDAVLGLVVGILK